MRSHFHFWIDYDGLVFSMKLLKWGRIFSRFLIDGGKKILVSKDLKICGLAVKKVVIVLPKETNIRSFIDQGIDYYRVGVLRGQRHKLSKNLLKYPRG